MKYIGDSLVSYCEHINGGIEHNKIFENISKQIVNINADLLVEKILNHYQLYPYALTICSIKVNKIDEPVFYLYLATVLT